MSGHNEKRKNRELARGNEHTGLFITFALFTFVAGYIGVCVCVSVAAIAEASRCSKICCHFYFGVHIPVSVCTGMC